MNKKKIRIFFTDFASDFNLYDNFITKVLTNDYEIEVSAIDPDILFYSWEGDNYKYFNCIKVFYTPEDLKPRFWECDFALSFWHDRKDKNLRFPNYVLYNYKNEDFIKPNKSEIIEEIEKKTGFCSIVVSNPNSKKRIDFFHKLTKYKKIDSGGRVLNNIGSPVKNKIEFITKYKFNIAFENTSSKGYTTEKIVDAMVAKTIPIYWGDPFVSLDFNPKSFFNYSDYQTEDDLIEDIIIHDKDNDKYFNKFIQPWFENGFPNQNFDQNRLRKFLMDIIENKNRITPVSKSLWRGRLKPILAKSISYLNNRIK